jgi:hypothetical protein
MNVRPFAPDWGSTTSVTNAIAATAAVVLPKNSQAVVLTNTSSTARVHVMVTTYFDESTVPTGTAPTTSTGLPILPNSQIRVTVGPGNKVIRTIATAADGVILITPGDGI